MENTITKAQATKVHNRFSTQSLVSKDLIFSDMQVTDRWEAIDKLAAHLLAKGFVRETYADAVKEREKVFPTGLPTMPVAVAIPHCDIQHCIRPAIAVGILRDTVPWIEMATLVSWLNVKVVLLLCITDPQAQVNLLRDVVDFFAAPHKLETLLNTVDQQAIVDLLAMELTARDAEE
ncbi:MAG: PTS sugar transporter subunit IIA [Proteobacteria bacterium]|nr:PTS sugar transporter subunit IIA [Pseudomonadota bacterium]